MLITRVKVNRFGLFSAPIDLEFGPGINLVSGPNESGKSTLMHAIRSGLTLKSTTTGSLVARFRPRDKGGVPEVEIDFEHQGVRYRVAKKFAGQSGVTRLEVWREGRLADRWAGDEAEARLRGLLGVRDTGRARKTTEHLGIWPLVWIDQGRSAVIPSADMNADAQTTLSGYLAALSGTTLSGANDAGLEQAVQQEYDVYWTKTGREATGARSPLHRARTDLEEARKRYRGLTERLEQHEASVARYVALGEEIAQLHTQVPEFRSRVERASRQLSLVERVEKEIEDVRSRLKFLGSDKKRREERLEERHRRVEKIGATEDALESARATLEETQRLVAEHRSRRRDLEREKARLEEEATEQRRRLDRVAAGLEVRRLESALTGTRKSLKEARDYHQHIVEAEAELKGMQVTDKALGRLEKAASKVEKARHALEVAAAGVQFRPLKPVQIHVAGGEVLELEEAPSSPMRVTSPTVFKVDDLVEIEVTPGGTDMADLREAVASAEKALEKKLVEFGVDNLEDARRQVQRATELQRQRDDWVTFLGLLAPNGLDDLEREHQEQQFRLEAARQRFEQRTRPDDPELPDDDQALADLKTVLEAESGANARAFERARNKLSSHDVETERLNGEVRLAEQRVASLEAELKAAQQALAVDRDTHGSDEELEQALTEATAALLGAERELEMHEQDLARLNPDKARADVERFRRALEEVEEELRDKEREHDTLEGATTAVDLVGLHERLDAALAEFEGAQKVVEQEERRANAVKLLRDVIADAKRTVQETYLRPLVEELQPMVRILFGDATISVRQDFSLERILRPRAGEDTFDSLSLGTREQLGVIMRLAMARVLAADGTLPVILDDALTASDRGRFEQMSTVLSLAAQKLQLVIFTCHPDRYRSEGILLTHHHDLSDHRVRGSAQ